MSSHSLNSVHPLSNPGREEGMVRRQPVGFWARTILLIALALAILGNVLQRSRISVFWGGLIEAFATAALVGGLADWFAVRALFTHPLGIKFFPHTALIPRNRERIVREISSLVQNEWLTAEMLTARVNTFDFVGDGLLSLVVALKPKLRSVLRTVVREVIKEVSPEQLALYLSQSAGQAIDAAKVAPFAADVVHRVRTDGWLEPLLREFIHRFQDWAGSAENRQVIRHHLKQAADAYCRRGVWKSLTYSVAEWSGGIDLEDASAVLQSQVSSFAAEQLSEDSQLNRLVREGLEYLETQLRDNPNLAEQVQSFVQRTSESGSLGSFLDPLLTSLQTEGLRQLDSPDSLALVWLEERLEGWIERLAQDPEMRNRLNAWCRRMVTALVARHHSLIGAMVEDRLNRFSDENLVTMIEDKVGEDLNWIRINGSLVGGSVGVLLYLTTCLVNVLLFPNP